MTEQKKETQQPLDAATLETAKETMCSRPGELLKKAREAKGLTQEEVAIKLNFLPLYVPALENENFEPLHSVTFVKGYLRAYARFLDIDADEVLRCFAVHHPDLVKQEVQQPIEVMRSEKNTSSLIFKLFSFIVIVALIAVIIMWWQSRSVESLPNVSNQEVQVDTLDGKTIAAPVQVKAIKNIPTLVKEVENTETSPAVEAQQVKSEPVKPEPVKPEPVVVATPVTKPTPKVEDKPITVAPVARVPSRAISGDPAVATQGNTRLMALTFSNECWVEVRDATGRMLHASLMQANDNVLLEGKPPFQAVFGNGTVAKVFYNGKAFDFASSIRPNGYASVKIQ